MKIYISFFAILVFAISNFGQKKTIKKPITKPSETAEVLEVPRVEKKTPAQKIIIEKTNGDRLTGLLVGGDTEIIAVEISGSNLSIKTNEIKAIWFGDAKPETVVSQSPAVNYAANAIKSLKQLAAATDVGVNFQDYSRRLIDVKAEVEESIVNIKDDYVKNEIKMAMDAYTDAGSAWNFAVQNRGVLFIDFEPAITLRPKYNLQTSKLGSMTLIYKESALSTIWAAARKHIELAGAPKTEVMPSDKAPETDITGLWKISASLNGESANFNLLITRENDSYYAVLQSPQGNSGKSLMKINGNTFSAVFSESQSGQLGNAQLEGTFEQNTIKGAMKVSLNGQIGTLSVTGTK